MPIMAAQGLNDARTAARVLASAAKDCLENPQNAGTQAVVLNNVYRLLETYRANTLFGLEPESDQLGASETLSLIPPAEQHVREVRDVLERARETIFAGQTKDEAIIAIEDVLKRVVYPEVFGANSDMQRTKAAQFFVEVLAQL